MCRLLSTATPGAAASDGLPADEVRCPCLWEEAPERVTQPIPVLCAWRRLVALQVLGRDHAGGPLQEADGGSVLRREQVVGEAADGYSTLFEMLGGRYGGAEARERYARWSTFPPIGIVGYGVAHTYPDRPADNLIRLERPLSAAGHEVDELSCSILRGPAFAPAGKAVVKVYFETEFDYWNDLQRADRARYDAEKAQVAAQVLDRLQAHLPGIADAIEMTDVATPYTFWRYTRNWRGAYEGWLMTPEQSMRPLPKTLPGLAGFVGEVPAIDSCPSVSPSESESGRVGSVPQESNSSPSVNPSRSESAAGWMSSYAPISARAVPSALPSKGRGVR